MTANPSHMTEELGHPATENSSSRVHEGNMVMTDNPNFQEEVSIVELFMSPFRGKNILAICQNVVGMCP